MNMRLSFGKEDTLPKDPLHPELRSHWLRVVVRISDSHLLDGVVVGDTKSLGAEWEEVSDDGSISLMPFALRDTDFGRDDGEELAP